MLLHNFIGGPKRSKPFQLVKHFDECNQAKITYPLIAQRKHDGVFGAFVVGTDLSVKCFGRSGKELSNTESLYSIFQDVDPGVYLSEVCSSVGSLEQLSGVVNPNRTKPLDADGIEIKDAMYIRVFDCLTTQEVIAGYSSVGFKERYYRMMDTPLFPYQCGNFHIHSREALDILYRDAVRLGWEGIVIKDPNGDWKAGRRNLIQMKMVRQVSYDLLCIGWEEGSGKRSRQVSNLIFRWRDGKTIKADLGKGWSDYDRYDLYRSLLVTPHAAIGRIYRVYALQESSKGVLRLPKVGEHRTDKVEADF